MAETQRVDLLPGEAVPDFEVALARGGVWRLSDQAPERFTLIEIYRGRHCPRCKIQLVDLHQKLARFRERGVEPIAISMDGAASATDTAKHWGLDALPLGYGLSESTARQLGLYLSDRIGDHEPARFTEPAILLIRPDTTLYALVYSTTPVARIRHADLLEGLDAIIARNYPPRGGA